MRKMLLRIGACALLFTVVNVGAWAQRSNAITGAIRIENTEPQDSSIRRGTKLARKRRTRKSGAGTSGQHSIIFVGGKKNSAGAATRANPIRAKKSNGSLNPQPIPPGKKH
jgi:hypothetical protein